MARRVPVLTVLVSGRRRQLCEEGDDGQGSVPLVGGLGWPRYGVRPGSRMLVADTAHHGVSAVGDRRIKARDAASQVPASVVPAGGDDASAQAPRGLTFCPADQAAICARF